MEPTPLRVLVVDDDADCAITFAEMLEMFGHEALAITGGDLYGFVNSFDPDVIVLDLMMPETTGFELAEMIRADESRASIVLIALTGHDGKSWRAKAKECGIDQFLVKPADPEKIECLLSEIAEKKRSLAESWGSTSACRGSAS